MGRSIGALDTLSRLKGIETERQKATVEKAPPSLDTLSRLKGIETNLSSGGNIAVQNPLDTLSRLKGIETMGACSEEKVSPLWIHFPV